MNIRITYEMLAEVYEQKGYIFFDTGTYNLNLFGIRSKDLLVNEFNDYIGVAYKDDLANPRVLVFQASTKPGYYWLKKAVGNLNGTAILVPGQYRSCWELGFYKNYEALVQRFGYAFNTWRDNDADGELDMNGRVYEDVTGLNLHTTSFISNIDRVGKYSAGCQVIQDDLDFNILLSLVKKSSFNYGTRFSYTLLEEVDFD